VLERSLKRRHRAACASPELSKRCGYPASHRVVWVIKKACDVVNYLYVERLGVGPTLQKSR
jgi:hypothetical protein